MKRWTTILGRGGTTLIAISLALLLVSLIPPITLSRPRGVMYISSKEVHAPYNRILTPQEELRINITVEGNINAYLLEVSREPLTEELDETENDTATFNHFGVITYKPLFETADELEDFLETQADLIIWAHTLEDESFEMRYSPTRVMNATFVVYNPSSVDAVVNFEATITSSLAPAEKVRTIAYFAAPIGVIMAGPWLLSDWKQKKQKEVNQRHKF